MAVQKNLTNLVDTIPFPVTTNINSIINIINYIRKYSDGEIIIGEGTGTSISTMEDNVIHQ